AALEAELKEREIEVPVLWGNRNSPPFLADTFRDAAARGLHRIVVVAYYVGFISPLVVWGVAALVFGIRMVAIVLHLNAPQPFRLGDPR
ncbi:MAG TPA: ferrochelatase, partial [Lapillicoccus sp.]